MPEADAFNFSGLLTRVDALIRLIQNGRLSPEMIADYTYSCSETTGLISFWVLLKRNVLKMTASI